jgi:hypothetical protein
LRGLLLEPARTNSIRNNTMQGGAPGVLPTNWVSPDPGNGLTRTIIGTGIEDGIEYIRQRVFGTTTAAVSFVNVFEGTTVIAASQGQTWAASVFPRLVSGSLPALNLFFMYEYDVSGLQTTNQSISVSDIDGSPLRAQRKLQSRTLTQAATAYTGCGLFLRETGVGVDIDFTIDIGLPQIELGADISSVIKTSGSAATRAAETLTISNLIAKGFTEGLTYPTTITYEDDTTASANKTVTGGAISFTGTQTKAIKSFSMQGPAI